MRPGGNFRATATGMQDWSRSCLVPTDRSALDNATLLPACRKPPFTRVLYSDAVENPSVRTTQCARGGKLTGFKVMTDEVVTTR